jgi:hypothetical protein
MADETPRTESRREKRREAKRAKKEQTGDSPEKAAERKKPLGDGDGDVAGAMWHTGTAGYLSGGF